MRKIARLLESLEKKGVIVSGNYNKAKYDRTKWYALNQEPSDLSKMTNGFVKSVQPIPYINTDINNSHDNSVTYIGKSSTRQFTPPTLEEVEQYCKERNNSVDYKMFYDYYSVSDWCDGKGNKVKNWKQKLITWEKKDTNKKKQEPVNYVGNYNDWSDSKEIFEEYYREQERLREEENDN